MSSHTNGRPTAARLASDCASVIHGDSSLFINLMLTEVCNFSCAHCSMRASPKSPKGFMTHNDLMDIFAFVERITNENTQVTYNLVGGEPTLNLETLEMVLRTLSSHGHSVEMTTNGWWLRSPTAFCDTVAVLRPYLMDGTMQLRISSSEYHDVYRKGERLALSNHERLVAELEEGMPELREAAMTSALKPIVATCPDCGNAVRRDPAAEEWHCGECDTTLYDSDIEEQIPIISRIWSCAAALSEAVASCYLYVDRQLSTGLTNNGRAADNQMATKGGNCGWDESEVKFTFKPGALVHDFCCSGGPSYGGHASDGLKLLLRRTLLLQELHADYPSNPSSASWDDPAAFSRCDVCPGRSVAHFLPGSAWDKLVNRALPILRRKLEKLEVAA